MTSASSTTCPVCSTTDPRRIVYGFPGPDLLDDPDVFSGGCVIRDEPPGWRCRNPRCAHEFGHAAAR